MTELYSPPNIVVDRSLQHSRVLELPVSFRCRGMTGNCGAFAPRLKGVGAADRFVAHQTLARS